jgi:hypothetical protein
MPLRHAFQIGKFFSEAADYANVDASAVADAGVDASRHISVHRRIVAVSLVFGLIGAAAGVAMIVLGASGAAPRKDGQSFLLAPFLFAAMGSVLGAASSIAFVPNSFLAGPMGQKWMRLIGTNSLLVARIVCSIFLILTLAIVSVFAAIVLIAP